jgi:septum formation protein
MGLQPYKGILLASASPRRRELLAQLAPQLDVFVSPSEIDEERYFDLDFIERSKRLAIDKARAVQQANPEHCAGRLLLAADTEVALNGEPFGKAQDAAEAAAMLQQLSGRSHQVVTAFCLLDPDKDKLVAGHCETQVLFRELNEELVAAYVATSECFGKAGAYAIQGQGGALVAGIHGSYSNVVGLPLETISSLLQAHFSWDVWAS